MRFAWAQLWRISGCAIPQTLHLVLLTVMLLAFASPPATASWQCENRVCGPTALACCCVAPDDDHDAECGPLFSGAHLATLEHAQEVGDCPTACHCTMVVQDIAGEWTRVVPAVPPLPLMAVLSCPAPLVEVDVPTVLVELHPLETRGPPPPLVFLASAPRRGPPVA